MIETGKVLQQRYRIDKQIGQGGMGAVYVATDERFGSTVAIKETLCMDDNFRKALEREARLLNSLKHVALPRVTDHFLEDDGQFLVMEFVPGDDLHCILEKQQEPFPFPQVLDWGHQLLDALDFLHSQENPVIHRDIKPQNLKVTLSGQIVLLDFGLAKGNPTDAGHKTAAKSIFGYSRNYASLEQIQGTGTDPRSDLYSLAATLYHLMTGVAPEDALTRAMAVLSQQPDPLVPASSIKPEIPAGVSAILQKALDLSASLRPCSAAEMRAMLRDHRKYERGANLNAPAIPQPIQAGVFEQRTSLYAEATKPEPNKITEAKTELLPEYHSQVTSVRGAVADGAPPTDMAGRPYTHAVPKKRSRFALAAGGLAALLFAGAAVAGVYVYDPSVFGVAEKPSAVGIDQPVTTAAENAVAPNPPEPAATEDQSASADFGGSGISENQTKRNADTNSKTTVDETAASKTTTPDRKRAGTAGDDLVITDTPVYSSNTRTSRGRIPNQDGGIVVREPKDMDAFPQDIPRDLLRQLTPEQRRKLRIMRPNNSQIVTRPTPY